LAFLDEEEQVVAPEEPERPRRVGGPERRRQQYLVRRLIAVGVGVGFLILLVLGFRSCLEARSDRGLRNYTQSISTIMQESEQSGAEFFESFDDPAITEQQLEEQIRRVRSTAASDLDRAENASPPDQMGDAHSAITQALRLRRDALEVIAGSVGAATADEEQSDSIQQITDKMGSLYASDVLWTQLAVPEITEILNSEQIEAPDLPAGNFMPPDGAKYLEQTEVVSLITGISGEDAEAGEHGLGLVGVTLGDITLDPETTTEVADDSREVAIQVQNQGTSEEADVVVTVTLNGEEIQQSIPTMDPGATETVKLQLTTLPQPGTEATLDVLVQPVAGEQVSENNEASYNVIFGSSAG
jgi:hypothetical protein